jgi:hypothetical protein
MTSGFNRTDNFNTDFLQREDRPRRLVGGTYNGSSYARRLYPDNDWVCRGDPPSYIKGSDVYRTILERSGLPFLDNSRFTLLIPLDSHIAYRGDGSDISKLNAIEIIKQNTLRLPYTLESLPRGGTVETLHGPVTVYRDGDSVYINGVKILNWNIKVEDKDFIVYHTDGFIRPT